jgi:hypothetical protein
VRARERERKRGRRRYNRALRTVAGSSLSANVPATCESSLGVNFLTTF